MRGVWPEATTVIRPRSRHRHFYERIKPLLIFAANLSVIFSVRCRSPCGRLLQVTIDISSNAAVADIVEHTPTSEMLCISIVGSK